MNNSGNGSLRVGDRFTMNISIRRPWWAFWRPRVKVEERCYIVASEVTTARFEGGRRVLGEPLSAVN